MEYLFSFNDDARVTVTCDGQSFFEQNPICLPDGYAITGQADGFLLTKTDAAAESVLPDIKITSEPIENGLRIFLESASDPDTPDAVNLAYPAPFAVHSDDEIALPFYEGILFRADELPPPVPKQLGCPGGSSVSMGFWGVLRGGSWLMTAVITNADAGVSLLPKSTSSPS